MTDCLLKCQFVDELRENDKATCFKQLTYNFIYNYTYTTKDSKVTNGLYGLYDDSGVANTSFRIPTLTKASQTTSYMALNPNVHTSFSTVV